MAKVVPVRASNARSTQRGTEDIFQEGIRTEWFQWIQDGGKHERRLRECVEGSQDRLGAFGEGHVPSFAGFR